MPPECKDLLNIEELKFGMRFQLKSGLNGYTTFKKTLFDFIN